MDVGLEVDDVDDVKDDEGGHEVLVHAQTVTLQRPEQKELLWPDVGVVQVYINFKLSCLIS